MKLTRDMYSSLKADLCNGSKFKVTIRDGRLGCSDLQDACREQGFLVLKQLNDNYMIYDCEEFESLCCTDDFSYICMIIKTVDIIN